MNSAIIKVKTSANLVRNVQKRITLPEKLKGTIVEKWSNYWKNLFMDYTQMLQDLRTDMQDNPRKAFIWSSALAAAYVLAARNPSEIDFKDTVKRVTNDAILVSEECRNSKSIDHLRLIEQSYNEGVLHYRSLGVISIMYMSELNNECDLYKAHCSYLQPTYFGIFSRIIDIGMMGRWWNVFIKTTNYDVA
ncbi:unnamed protein product [Leptidea sinapis]|uniref:Mitochondrial import inner membrane translocase subunit Tim29 n=1 Tax=Leptidea sinapis TaxID=189913 RepID=A0A5E4QAI2_9NEOP|nr:unnamed protein product [Leptidea sinapis]